MLSPFMHEIKLKIDKEKQRSIHTYISIRRNTFLFCL